MLTFARGADGALDENRDVRGLHPMMAERMELWRLSNFELERLPASPDVYLFPAVARDNPRDERLVALAEVRDLTPVRDDDGRITALPELERMVRQAFEAMRSAQSRRPARQRLLWNRLMLYAWPAMEFRPEDAAAIIARYAGEHPGGEQRDGGEEVGVPTVAADVLHRVDLHEQRDEGDEQQRHHREAVDRAGRWRTRCRRSPTSPTCG